MEDACNLRLSGRLRVACGGVLLVLGYMPVLLECSNMALGGFSHITNERICSASKTSCDLFPPIFEGKLTSCWQQGCLASLSVPAAIEDSDVSVKVAVRLPTYRAKNIDSGPWSGGKVVKGRIVSNFYVDARQSGIPARVIDKVVGKLSGKIDFRRSLKKGDTFEIAFDGKNEVIYSKIKTKKEEVAVYKFEKEGYFFENGERVVAATGSATFGAPLRGKLRISSGYGYRRHPVSGKLKRHTGVDFSAKYGTPVCAVFDGVVVRASNYAGYGRCVDIQHKNGYSSRYAHLSRYAVKLGASVKKGQVIAYSGSSGLSTGPHLHLELARNKVTVNPLSVKMMPTRIEKVSDMKKFNAMKKHCCRLVASLD